MFAGAESFNQPLNNCRETAADTRVLIHQLKSQASGKLISREGPAALLAGWWPAYCRLAPHAILTFPLLEQLRRLAGLENF